MIENIVESKKYEEMKGTTEERTRWKWRSSSSSGGRHPTWFRNHLCEGSDKFQHIDKENRERSRLIMGGTSRRGGEAMYGRMMCFELTARDGEKRLRRVTSDQC